MLKLLLFAVLASATSAAKLEPAAIGRDPLFISAFNVQIFGKSKMSKPNVVDILVQIVRRYDLVVIQEIRDIDEIAFPQLVSDVNSNLAPTEQYDSFMGERVGRSSSKEQYGFIYKKNRLQPLLRYEYDEGNKDDFEREPHVVKFQRVDGSGVQKIFAFIPLHAKPDDAVNEIDALAAVYADSLSRTGTEDAIIAGDLNADCSYVCSSCWSDISLRTDSKFEWLISDHADTTVSTTNCAYDRIITTGSVTDNSHGANVFLFDDFYGLSNEEAKDVSDHYPVEFFLD